MKRRFLLVVLLCMPFMAMADSTSFNVDAVVSDIKSAPDIKTAAGKYEAGVKSASDAYSSSVKQSTRDSEVSKAKEKATSALSGKSSKSGKTNDNKTNDDKSNNKPVDTRTDAEKAEALATKQQAYDDAKANEQSTANKTLTALTTAATGIGGMELAEGLSEQKADKEAAQDMAAYIATMRCTYADGKQAKAGPEEIELPGGNDQTLMNLRAEYFALAKDLKERKNALGMKPGIESEEILDKASTGLYDDESLGIEAGAYASLYRAQMLGSEADQAKIDDEKSASKNRVMGGAIAAGAGVLVGVVGNSLINGKLGEKIKEKKEQKKLQTSASIDRKETIKTLTNDELEQIKNKYFSTSE